MNVNNLLLNLIPTRLRNPMELTDDEKKTLLQVARKSIEAAVKGIPVEKFTLTDRSFLELRGVFVTLRLSGELRGCIGYVEPRLPLGLAVEEVAVKSALEDPRFYPVSSEEVDSIDIEISILSPLKKVSDVHEIEVGRDGLVIELGARRGLLLPQVAVEYDWNREELLSHTSLKAGLPSDAWKNKSAEIFSFTTDIFSGTKFKESIH